jgi:hypothetical protein
MFLQPSFHKMMVWSKNSDIFTKSLSLKHSTRQIFFHQPIILLSNCCFVNWGNTPLYLVVRELIEGSPEKIKKIRFWNNGLEHWCLTFHIYDKIIVFCCSKKWLAIKACLNRTPCVSHLCMNTTVISCYRCLINTCVKK